MMKKDKTMQLFWENKKLSELTDKEWEAVCDKCGKCCLVKIGMWRIRFTKIACPLLDVCSGRCKDYAKRWDTVPDCIKLTPQNIKKCKKWLPKTCAYLWLMKYKTLPPWHPLISGKRNSVHTYGISVKDRAIPYIEPDNYEDYVVKWQDL